MINDIRSFIILEPFMIDLKLPQAELFCYAIIYSFSKQKQGCFYGTQGYLADQIAMSRQAVNQALLSLEEKGLIVKTATLKRFEYATVVDRGATTVDKKGATTVAGMSTTVDTGATTVAQIIKYNKHNIKKKESKKEKKTDFDFLIEGYTDNLELQKALVEFVKMRLLIKRKPTNRALELIFKKLDLVAGSDEKKVKIINQSILNGWQDIYPLKEETMSPQHGKDKILHSQKKNYSAEELNTMFENMKYEDI